MDPAWIAPGETYRIWPTIWRRRLLTRAMRSSVVSVFCFYQSTVKKGSVINGAIANEKIRENHEG
ncbi:hypothetical protein JGUZn3_09230 [Entomobacter blattae]|uniref:Uncharacterized protein n=1 Tax=Entomobacter blattae TaxID=2762277 RepID=A0A7H1NQU5_9PROT|nr:hypothetical protein JGUZn3_09230 [Entomobacter blattae]